MGSAIEAVKVKFAEKGFIHHEPGRDGTYLQTPHGEFVNSYRRMLGVREDAPTAVFSINARSNLSPISIKRRAEEAIRKGLVGHKIMDFSMGFRSAEIAQDSNFRQHTAARGVSFQRLPVTRVGEHLIAVFLYRNPSLVKGTRAKKDKAKNKK